MTIDVGAIVAEHAAITDVLERARKLTSTLRTVDELRLELVKMRREDFRHLTGDPRAKTHAEVPMPGSELGRQIGLSAPRVSDVINGK